MPCGMIVKLIASNIDGSLAQSFGKSVGSRNTTKLLDFLEDLRLRYPENPSRAESSTYRWA